jgi:Leucine-rich repeat (LRR) protein
MTQDSARQLRLGRPVALLLILGAVAATFFIIRVFDDRPMPVETAAPPGPAETIQRLGGKVEHSGTKRLAVTLKAATDRNLQLVLSLEHVVSLDLSGSAITDQGLRKLHAMTGLEILKLDNTQITDDSLELLKSLSKLKHLSLAGTPIRGPGLVHLRGLTKLRVLFLSCTRVDDEGLSHLSAMSQLEILFLNAIPLQEVTSDTGDRNGGQITDAGLMHLGNLTGLKILDVQNTSVTEAGAADFRAALPTCNLRY